VVAAQKLREHEQKTGTRIVDAVDVHFYPQGRSTSSATTRSIRRPPLSVSARRAALWDPTYKDESWIADTVMLVPRLKKWIAENYPGRAISIGEYNFGGEKPT
jgi:hypothetical protein